MHTLTAKEVGEVRVHCFAKAKGQVGRPRAFLRSEQCIYSGATIDDWDILLALSPFLTIRNVTMATTFLGNHLRVRYIFMVCLSQPGPVHKLIDAGPPCGATHLPAAIHSFDDRRSLDDGLSFECSGDDFGLPPPGRYPKLAKSRIRV